MYGREPGRGGGYGAGVVNRATPRIVRDFGAWQAERRAPDPVDGSARPDGRSGLDVVRTLLDARDRWLGCPDPTLWRSGDTHRLLVDTVAARLPDRHGLGAHGVPLLRAYLDFLDETDRFHPAGVRPATLRKELERAAGKYPAAMADRSGWSVSKAVLSAMLAEGVDPGTPDGAVAARAWLAELSGAEEQRRRAVLGPLPDRDPTLLGAGFTLTDDEVVAVPASAAAAGVEGDPLIARILDNEARIADTQRRIDELAATVPTAELAADVRVCPMLSRLVTVARWAGAGRRVNRQALLGTEDTRSLAATLGLRLLDGQRDQSAHLTLNELWHLALAVQLLRLHRTSVVAGPALAVAERVLAGVEDPESALRFWVELFDAAISDPIRAASRSDTVMHEFAGTWGRRAVDELYGAGPFDLDQLVETLLGAYDVGGTRHRMLPRMVGVMVRHAMHTAARCGAVAVTATDAPDQADEERRTAELTGAPSWSMFPVPGVLVELTALGEYAVLASGRTPREG